MDTRPTKFLREFMGARVLQEVLAHAQAAAVQDDLFGAAEEERVAIERSNVAAWLLMEPTADFVSGLSASAIDTYEQCPLRFKLERDWNLPRDVPASLQYGAAMHRVLHTFYDAQRYGREISDEQLLENFRADLATAGIADRYQYELYLRQGREQLTQFLEWARVVGAAGSSADGAEIRFAGCRNEVVGAGRPDGSAGIRRRCDRRLQDRQTEITRGRGQEPAALSVCAGGERGVGIARRSIDLSQPGRQQRGGDDSRCERSWKRQKREVQEAAESIAAGNSPPNLASSADFARIAICVRRRRR